VAVSDGPDLHEDEIGPPSGEFEALLAPGRWVPRSRDPELRKALGVVATHLSETRRLLELAKSRGRGTIAELRALLEVDPNSLTVDSAWGLAGQLKRLNLRLGDTDFVRSRLEYENHKDGLAGRSHRWSDHFTREDLDALLLAAREDRLDDALLGEAVERLTFLDLVREEAGRNRRAQLRTRARYAAGTTTAIAVALLAISIGGLVGVRPDLWKTVVVVLAIGLLASPALVAPWVASLRDRTTRIEELTVAVFGLVFLVVLGLAMSVACAGGFAAVHLAALRLTEQEKSTQALLVGAGAAALTAVIVAITGFWRRWVFWRRRTDEHVLSAALAGLVALAALIELFAVVTVALDSYGAIEPAKHTRPRLGLVEQYYAWHLADALPLLEVPKTMNWARPLTYDDHGAGVLLLAYKLLVILPIAALIAALLDRWRRDDRGMSEQPRSS
jgi:hypothetical protein